uniref:Uncharacterized protein n=1 Tax=Rhizophora mucronata TaxID=61149 RepID=A0A2P2QMV7_RHIMU
MGNLSGLKYMAHKQRYLLEGAKCCHVSRSHGSYFSPVEELKGWISPLTSPF